ncbi:MAG: hypothetical protein KGL35_20730 [Bradyrhizobium sp.]|nr:hypothetical protein [Bradyrhizobium sp.]
MYPLFQPGGQQNMAPYYMPSMFQGANGPNWQAPNQQQINQMVAPWYQNNTSGLSAMLKNEQAMQGIAALGHALASRQSQAPQAMPAAPAPVYNGDPNYKPSFF